MEKISAPTHPATPAKGQLSEPTGAKQAFFGAALNMSWQLAIVVLIPIVGGAKLDSHFKTTPTFILIGFAMAMIGTGLVMWQALQAANRLPVPKLSAAQKRAIQKQYQEDDD